MKNLSAGLPHCSPPVTPSTLMILCRTKTRTLILPAFFPPVGFQLLILASYSQSLLPPWILRFIHWAMLTMSSVSSHHHPPRTPPWTRGCPHLYYLPFPPSSHWRKPLVEAFHTLLSQATVLDWHPTQISNPKSCHTVRPCAVPAFLRHKKMISSGRILWNLWISWLCVRLSVWYIVRRNRKLEREGVTPHALNKNTETTSSPAWERRCHTSCLEQKDGNNILWPPLCSRLDVMYCSCYTARSNQKIEREGVTAHTLNKNTETPPIEYVMYCPKEWGVHYVTVTYLFLTSLERGFLPW